MRVPLFDLAAQERAVAVETLAAVQRVAGEARFILGGTVEAFERWLAAACGATHAVGVASGTDAIELALRALGVGEGDAVVTPAFSFVAAAEAIACTRAQPVFCDVEPDTMNASARTVSEAMARARSSGLRVAACVPVHLFGAVAEVGALDVPVVEDAAQAIGARDGAGRAAGAIGQAAGFSFFPTKNLGAWGDGGAVVTSDAELAARVRRLRAHGASAPYVHEELGRNSRLDALQAAVLLAKSAHLGAWQSARARLADGYLGALGSLPLTLPARPPAPAVSAWHAFVVRCRSSGRRDALAAWLRERGVETRVYYPLPLHRQPCFASLREPALPVAEEACRTALALPIHATMTETQHAHVVEQVRAFFD